jgi:hypothetical protein
MIVLQILAGLLLVPLTALMLIIFNVYATNWVCFLIISFFNVIYACLCGLLFLHSCVIAWVFILLSLLYIMKMSRIPCKFFSNRNSKKYPSVRAKIKSKYCKLHITFLFPLAFLKIIKLLPNKVSRELSRKTGMDINIHDLVDVVLDASIGTRIDIQADDVEIYFEIQ